MDPAGTDTLQLHCGSEVTQSAALSIRNLAVGAKGAWLCAKAVFPYMQKQEKGKIINLSSDTVFAPTKGMINYITSKAAVIGITRVLAGELGKLGARVDEHDDGLTVHPGPLHGARVDPHRDHRLAMAFAVVGLRVASVEIENPGCVAKSFPDFFEVLDSLRP